MASYAEDLGTAMTAEIKMAAKRKGITVQEEFTQRCLQVVAWAEGRAEESGWDGIVDKSLIGTTQKTS